MQINTDKVQEEELEYNFHGCVPVSHSFPSNNNFTEKGLSCVPSQSNQWRLHPPSPSLPQIYLAQVPRNLIFGVVVTRSDAAGVAADKMPNFYQSNMDKPWVVESAQCLPSYYSLHGFWIKILKMPSAVGVTLYPGNWIFKMTREHSPNQPASFRILHLTSAAQCSRWKQGNSLARFKYVYIIQVSFVQQNNNYL